MIINWKVFFGSNCLHFKPVRQEKPPFLPPSIPRMNFDLFLLAVCASFLFLSKHIKGERERERERESTRHSHLGLTLRTSTNFLPLKSHYGISFMPTIFLSPSQFLYFYFEFSLFLSLPNIKIIDCQSKFTLSRSKTLGQSSKNL